VAIDIAALVAIDLEPVFELDTTLQLAIPSRVEAETALRGWTEADITDRRAVYIALLVTKSFVARLLLRFSQELRKAGAGKATVEFSDALKYLTALQAELNARLLKAETEMAPDSVLDDARWPGCGVLGL
jgi:hypothetical protein